MNRLSAALGLAVLLSGCEPAFAQEQSKSFCLPRDIMVATLTQGGAQRLIGQGLTTRGELLEVWISDDPPSWTVILTFPAQKVSCVAAAGREAWETIVKGRKA